MRDPLWTDYRRDLIARITGDLLKILFAAALASKFFAELGEALKIRLLILSLILGVLTFFVCPRIKPKE